MRRLALWLALLIPATAFGAGPARVAPVVRPLACASCALLPAGPAVAKFAPSPFAIGAPALAPAPAPLSSTKLILAASADVETAVAALAASPAAELGAANQGEPDARLMSLFDGSAPSGVAGADGAYAPVFVAPGVTSQETLALRLRARVDSVRGEVERAVPALRRSVTAGGWYGPNTVLDGPCCGDAAPKLAALLRLRGVPATVVEAEFHFYVVVRTPDGDVVVDPTFRQFFGREKAPADVPAAFVGTWGELDGFFSSHGRSKTTSYGVSRIYRSDARVREDLARGAAAALSVPRPASDYAALQPALKPAEREKPRPTLIIP